MDPGSVPESEKNQNGTNMCLFWSQIPDHNVPTLDMMFDLVEDVKKWLSQREGRVVALHCKVLVGKCGFFCTILQPFCTPHSGRERQNGDNDLRCPD